MAVKDAAFEVLAEYIKIMEDVQKAYFMRKYICYTYIIKYKVNK